MAVGDCAARVDGANTRTARHAVVVDGRAKLTSCACDQRFDVVAVVDVERKGAAQAAQSAETRATAASLMAT